LGWVFVVNAPYREKFIRYAVHSCAIIAGIV
jgi:hypothetical protein